MLILHRGKHTHLIQPCGNATDGEAILVHGKDHLHILADGLIDDELVFVMGVKFDTVFKTGDTAKWTYKAVQRILTNEVYIGVLAQGKRGTPNYKVRVVQPKDETEWVKVEGAHEALVSYEDFMAVKTMMKRDMRCSPDQDEAHLFSGFLFCAFSRLTTSSIWSWMARNTFSSTSFALMLCGLQVRLCLFEAQAPAV